MKHEDRPKPYKRPQPFERPLSEYPHDIILYLAYGIAIVFCVWAAVCALVWIVLWAIAR
jgi:hypothetical protein